MDDKIDKEHKGTDPYTVRFTKGMHVTDQAYRDLAEVPPPDKPHGNCVLPLVMVWASIIAIVLLVLHFTGQWL